MSSNLLDEAIADAKQIREAAEENAKQAVLEAVTPKIREFIENSILEQDEEDDNSESSDIMEDDNEDDDVELDETAIQSLLELMSDSQELKSNSDKQDLNEAVSRLTGDERRKLFDIVSKNTNSNENLSSRDIYNLKENKMNSREKYYEIDLKALREAVEGDMDEMIYEEEEDNILADAMPTQDSDPMEMDSELEMDDAPAGDDMLSRDEVEAQIEELIADLGLDIGGDMDMPEVEDLDQPDMAEEEDASDEDDPEEMNEVFDIDPRMLQQELRRIKNRVNEAKGGSLAHESGGIAKDYEHHFGGKGSAGSKGGDFGGGKPGKDVLSEMRRALRNQRRQNGALENKLTKYRSAVQTLREQLEELNLFNAKLLYVNKLLQNKGINESQKRSIVKALDEAKDLREAKVLYKSLTESFSKSTKTKSRRLNESARMASSSRTTKPAGSHASSASGEVDRWAKLAGLKK